MGAAPVPVPPPRPVDEDHVGAFQGFNDFIGILQSSFASDLWIRTRAQAIGQLDTELQLYRRARHAQRL